jgi:hypothetical protein
MGYLTQRTSDLSGEIVPAEELVTVMAKGHPATNGEAKVFDATIKEVEALKTVTGLVELELRLPGGSRTVFITAADLAKSIPDEKFKGFDSARGRRTGFRTNGNGH